MHIFGVVPNVCVLFYLLIAYWGEGVLELFSGDVFDTVREKYSMYMCPCFQIISVWLIKDEKAELWIKWYRLKNNAEIRALLSVV